MLGILKQGRLDLSPLEFLSMEMPATSVVGSDPAAVLSLRQGKKCYRFAVECKALSTPKVLQAALQAAKEAARKGSRLPAILVPYLPEAQLRMLEGEGVSGIDMCGNVLINVPGEILIFRSGAPNKYPRTVPIRNVYQKNSSVVARAFLLKPRYDSIDQLVQEIRSRGGSVTQPTVSRVCQSLDEDIVIARQKGAAPRQKALKTTQPDKLLELLAENYQGPTIEERLTLKASISAEQFLKELEQWAEQTKNRVVLSGSSSTNYYAVMGREPIQSFYCDNVAAVLKKFEGKLKEDARFPDIELMETADDFVYFDQRQNLVASPIQTYLELMQGDKREKETAQQVKDSIFSKLKEQEQL